jgi:LCP family protein required for cell wall assembly
MKKKRNRLFGQLLLLGLLFVICLGATVMIYLGATVFRSQLPFFRLIDGGSPAVVETGPEPATFPGVIDQAVRPTTRLYMILGSDFRPQAGFRTDVIVLMAVDSLSGKVSLVSFPRDLWVTIPGYYEQRINTVMQVGGFPLLANTMQANFGVYPTEYAMINMEGFLKVIDVLGGVEFETEYYTADACDSSLDPDRWCEVGPGMVSLDSDWALWYVRARYNSSDFDRMRRTQEVVQAVMKKSMSPAGLLKMPALMSIYESEVESNISPNELLPMIRLALGFNISEDVRHYSIGPNEATGWTTADGASVLIPNTAAIQAILRAALNFE